jgi:hypothetical protein
MDNLLKGLALALLFIVVSFIIALVTYILCDHFDNPDYYERRNRHRHLDPIEHPEDDDKFISVR